MATDLNETVELRTGDGHRSLYALKNFRQGQRILGLPMVTQLNPDKYSIEISPNIHLDCSQSLVGAINHSCRPNAAVRNGWVVAWSCIDKGDQVTINYNRTEAEIAEPFKCECGYCEGDWINGYEYL